MLCLFGAGLPFKSNGAPENAPPELLASDVLEVYQQTKYVSGSLRCRNCEKNCPRGPPRHAWDYMRVETAETSILSVEEPSALGVKFECAHCESTHIAEPLPAKGLKLGDQRWSMDFRAVRVRRATNSGGVIASEHCASIPPS